MAERAIESIFLGVQPAFLKIGSAQFSMIMGANLAWYCFCWWGSQPELSLDLVSDWDNSAVVYGNYFHAVEVDGVGSI